MLLSVKVGRTLGYHWTSELMLVACFLVYITAPFHMTRDEILIKNVSEDLEGSGSDIFRGTVLVFA
jgi:hypothetical protein